MVPYLWVAGGSALGGMARYWCSIAVAARLGNEFPWGTLLINILGSFVIGLFAALPEADGPPPEIRLFVMVGLCGGYTTFSAFSLQTLGLLRTGHTAAALANIALSVILCLAAVALGTLVAGNGACAAPPC
jgi:CrcB protein